MSRTLISILGGLGGMFGWGVSDFFANTASEKIGHLRAFFWSQIAGIALIALFVLFLAPSFAMPPLLLVLTACAGIAYGLGYLLFYKGFEIGNVSVVSSVSNLYAVFIVLISYFIRGQPLTAFQIPAMVSIFLGVTLVSLNFRELRQGTVSLLKGVKETIASTIMFGVFGWPLNEYVVEKADWLSVSFLMKLTAIVVVFILSIFQKKSLHIASFKKLVPLLFAVGLLEAGAVLSVTFGQSYGDGIIVAPISGALTIVTVSLAVLFSKEKITKVQSAGIALVVGGIITMAL